MNIMIKPSQAAGQVLVPPSKSAAHRLIISAGLAKGESIVHNVDMSQDIKATLDCLTTLGARWTYENRTVTITGCDSKLAEVTGELPCNECGSTIRFFVPICLISEKECSLTGTKKLLSRPMEIYEELCKEQGLSLVHEEHALITKGPLKSGNYEIAGNISSQFITGLLFALPMLPGDSVLKVTEPFESKPYVDMTMDALRQFGIRIEQEGETLFRIPGNQRYQANEVTVEGDWSNAAFLYALKAVQKDSDLLGKGTLTVEGTTLDSLQGDKVCIPYIEQLMAGRPTLDLTDCPDLAPILFALAGAYHGALFTGTRRLAFKESDRVTAMAMELEPFGIKVEKEENQVRVYSTDKLLVPQNRLSGHNDHRIVMAVATLLTITGGSIEGAQAVAKSYPDYFDVIRGLGILAEEVE